MIQIAANAVQMLEQRWQGCCTAAIRQKPTYPMPTADADPTLRAGNLGEPSLQAEWNTHARFLVAAIRHGPEVRPRDRARLRGGWQCD